MVVGTCAPSGAARRARSPHCCAISKLYHDALTRKTSVDSLVGALDDMADALARDALSAVFTHLPLKSLYVARKVCKEWRAVASEDVQRLWSRS